MAAAVYVVTVTSNPGVQYRVPRAEYEYLLELGLLASLVEVIAPRDEIVVSTTEPTAPFLGLVWFNPSIPA